MKRLQNTFEWPSLSSKPHTKSLFNEHFSFPLLTVMAARFHSAGETTYNLDTAGGLRLEVQKYYELIDALR